jgi:8-oxo-dGTP pyrophosphatase MutT (NUDIX family)
VARYLHTAASGDPSEVPVRDAATVMILRDEPEFEVLMVQRTSKVAFAASAWVFPGGRVDPEDQVPENAPIVGRTDEEASSILNVGSGGIAWWIAAVRETIEEAGLLLLDSASNPTSEAIYAVRASVHADSGALFPSLANEGLRLDLSRVHEVARFITPLGPPRRFDTRFFVAAAPKGQSVSPDHGEIVATKWVSPHEALELWENESFPLMSVTHRMLACLRRYSSVDEVIARAVERAPERRVRVNDPEGAYHVLLPEDPGYADAELEIEHGWVRL